MSEKVSEGDIRTASLQCRMQAAWARQACGMALLLSPAMRSNERAFLGVSVRERLWAGQWPPPSTAQQSAHELLNRAVLTGFPSWPVPNNCGCGIGAAVRGKPSLTRPPDVLGPTMGTFRAGENIWKVGKSSRITLDACRESAISVRARDHYNAHVSALAKGSPNVDFAADPSRCARCFCR